MVRSPICRTGVDRGPRDRHNRLESRICWDMGAVHSCLLDGFSGRPFVVTVWDVPQYLDVHIPIQICLSAGRTNYVRCEGTRCNNVV